MQLSMIMLGVSYSDREVLTISLPMAVDGYPFPLRPPVSRILLRLLLAEL